MPMNFKLSSSFIVLVQVIASCTQPGERVSIKESTEALAKAEKAFSDSTVKKGFMRAYLDFAADESVLFNDGDSVLSTVEDVRKRVANIPVGGKPPYEMTWAPEKIDVSGDLAYTYGRFKITSKDSIGNESIRKGLYSSVWKRQPDGEWKVVLD